ncbi:T9SS type A sorting domain-containing protein [Flavobacterium enshiense]|uniref:T9SS type A sorting domain-containing protein n=1 Tax=Flavobacterium enshiense TaxID=1341165 RepID=UPI00138AE117|nr:T9SS type A sorting domain-containing protein [Flavobacterium enshiense]
MVFLFCSTVYAQTNVSGGIYSNTIWKKVNNPYIVTDNIVVFPGVNLTIEPGVIAKFNPGVGLEVRGKLIAIGNENDSITFTSNLPSPIRQSWNGITVVGTDETGGVRDQVIMEYCKGEFANYFINLDIAYNGPYIFRHCYFANNRQVNYDGGIPSTIFENCKFESNSTALGGCQFASRVSNSVFINNVYGIEGFDNIENCFFSGHTVALSPYGSTVGCTIQNNFIGVRAWFNSTNNRFVNNTVSNNDVGFEIISYFDDVVFTGNTICNNNSWNLKLYHSNNADLSSNCWCSTDPSFISSTIIDGYENIEYGLVNFIPFMTSCQETENENNEPLDNKNFPPAAFPNPFNDQLTLRIPGGELTTIYLYDFLGSLVLQETTTKNSIIINTDQLVDGIYFYELRSDKGRLKAGKLIKQ